jgi:hypothetical protein
MTILLVVAAVTMVATVQKVHQWAREQDQIRDDPEQMCTVFLPQQNDRHEGEGDEHPAPRRIPAASKGMILPGCAHRSLLRWNGTRRAMQ